MEKGNSTLRKLLCAVVLGAMLFCLVPAGVLASETDDAQQRQVILLKFDDIREGTAVRNAFKKMHECIKEKGIKASFGVIGISLEDNGKKEEYYEDLKEFAADKNIEIWHHGYYHDSKNHVEFNGGTYDEQYKQMKDTIDLLKEHCGITVRTFGSPYNASDEVTLQVLNELPQMKCFFYPSVTEGGNQLMLTQNGSLETDVGVVDYDAFVKKYEASNKDKPYLVLQGHPGGFNSDSWDNFSKVIDYLIAQNVVFMTPTEYYNSINGISSVFPENYKFNKSLAYNTDVEAELTLNSNTLVSVFCGENELVKDSDYTVNGSRVSISKDYMMALDTGTYDFTFKFSAKDDAVMSVKIIEPDAEPIKVIVDDEQLTFDVEPMLINDRTMVPFRTIFEKFGAAVSYDGDRDTAIGKLDEITVRLPIDSATAYVNDKPVELDAAATVIDGRTLVPLRFISENFGATVKWYDETRTAKIVSGPVFRELAEGEFKGSGLKVVKVKSALKDYNQEAFTFDGAVVPDDRWAAEGTSAWILYELDDVYSIDSAAIAWYKGDARKSKFDIEISEDAVNYTLAYRGETTGTTDQLEKVEFAPVSGKYVRIVCKGNDSAASSTWNSLLEVEIYKEK